MAIFVEMRNYFCPLRGDECLSLEKVSSQNVGDGGCAVGRGCSFSLWVSKYRKHRNTLPTGIPVAKQLIENGNVGITPRITTTLTTETTTAILGPELL